MNVAGPRKKRPTLTNRASCRDGGGCWSSTGGNTALGDGALSGRQNRNVVLACRIGTVILITLQVTNSTHGLDRLGIHSLYTCHFVLSAQLHNYNEGPVQPIREMDIGRTASKRFQYAAKTECTLRASAERAMPSHWSSLQALPGPADFRIRRRTALRCRLFGGSILQVSINPWYRDETRSITVMSPRQTRLGLHKVRGSCWNRALKILAFFFCSFGRPAGPNQVYHDMSSIVVKIRSMSAFPSLCESSALAAIYPWFSVLVPKRSQVLRVYL